MNRDRCITEAHDPRHRFTCAACRADSRIAAAWKTLGDLPSIELPGRADEAFVGRAVDAILRDRRRGWLRRVALAAAAALLFAFFFGTSHERAAGNDVAANDSYSSLAAPNALETLIAD